MIDRYIYLLLAISFLLPSIAVFILRKDLRPFILKLGLIGGVMGLLIELWYLVDYWHPLSLFGQTVLSFEDFIVGFGIITVSSTFYLVAASQPKPIVPLRKRKEFVGIVIVGLVAMIVSTLVLHINSLVASTCLTFLIAAYMIIRRAFLLKRALLSGLALSVFGGVTYFILFGVLSPTYLENYFLLTGEWYNPALLGFYPLLELWWYFSWGVFAGALVGYLSDDPSFRLVKPTP